MVKESLEALNHLMSCRNAALSGESSSVSKSASQLSHQHKGGSQPPNKKVKRDGTPSAHAGIPALTVGRPVAVRPPADNSKSAIAAIDEGDRDHYILAKVVRHVNQDHYSVQDVEGEADKPGQSVFDSDSLLSFPQH